VVPIPALAEEEIPSFILVLNDSSLFFVSDNSFFISNNSINWLIKLLPKV